jgi:hypothetical protein
MENLLFLKLTLACSMGAILVHIILTCFKE